MADLVLLKCDIGSKAVTVLCPKCGRISRQILSTSYSPNRVAELIRPHSCPICKTQYNNCSASQAGNWSAAFSRYNRNSDDYNKSVKYDYEKKAPLKHDSTAGAKSEITAASPSFDSSWLSLFSMTILKRGKTYYNDGRVAINSRNASAVSGTVHGTERYSVQISFRNGQINNMYCSCPYSRSGEHCKHEAALLFALRDGDRTSDKGDELKELSEGEEPKHIIPSVFPETDSSSEAIPLGQTIAKKTEPDRSENPSFESKPVSTKSSLLASATNVQGTHISTSGVTPIISGETKMTPDEDLDRKIERWKKELLDTGKRNKMINFRETKRSTLRILEPEASELFNKLAFSERALSFQKPINKDTDLRTYSMIALMETLSYTLNVQVGDIKTAGTIIEREKTLKNLRSKAKLAQEEQGTNILYLCFGFIYWRAQNKDSSPWFKAPLLMMPVTIGLKSLNAPYTLSRYDDEIEVNPTLDYLFNSEYNIDLPTFNLKNKDSFNEYLQQIEEIVDKRGWKVVPEVSLGLLSFTKISMYHDLNNNRERMVNHPVIRAMAGDRSALMDIPASAEHYDFDAVKPEEWHEVVDSDSSQEEAILLSKLGISFVMQGPPGTGKSQTITNIIAEALADGKKILFVSEKAAALEVVFKRLTEVQLDDFCLSLHNYRANKKEIINSIGANLRLESEDIGRGVLNELTELFHDREFLTKYADDLHREIEPLGDSVYMVFGKLSKLEKASAISFRFDNPAAITREQYSSLLYVLNSFEKALQNIGGPLDTSPWHGTVVKSSGQAFKQQMLQETGTLPEKFKELEITVDAINEEYQTVIGHSWDSVCRGIDDLSAALNLPLFPFWWTDIAKQETLLSCVQREAAEHRSLLAPLQRCRETFNDTVLEAPIEEWSKRSKAVLDAYKRIGYTKESAGDSYLSLAIQKADAVRDLVDDLIDVSERCKDAAIRFGLTETDSVRNARRLNGILDRYEKRPNFREAIWFQSTKNAAALDYIGIVEEQIGVFRHASTAQNSVWSEGVRALDIDRIRRGLTEEYAWLINSISDTDSVEALFGAQKKSAKELLDKITALVNAHNRAISALGIVRGDSIEGLRSISTLLQQTSEVPYLETSWFDVRKNDAARPLIEEAYSHYTKISELTESILQKWEPEALNMDEEVLAMLGRFKTEHVGAFHRMKSGYKEDIKKIRLLSKEVGKTVDETEAIAFLQTLKEIHDEKQWYLQNQDLLKDLAGTYYRSTNTDWGAVKKGMEIAASIANSFPYANISEDVITAIQRSASSIQNAAELKELSDILSDDNISACESLLIHVAYVDPSATETSLGGMVLPQIRKFLDACDVYERFIVELQMQHRSGDSITGKELIDLFENEQKIVSVETWFSNNKEQLDSVFASKNRGVDCNLEEIGKGLIFAKEILGFFPDGVPEKLVSVLCDDMNEDGIALHADRQSLRKIDALAQRLQAYASFCYSETESIIDYLVPQISSWCETTGTLNEIMSEFAPYLAGEETTVEQAIVYLPAVLQVKTMRKQLLIKESGLAKQLGDRYQGADTNWEKIEADILAVKNFLSAYTPSVSREFLEIICDSEDLRADAQERINKLSMLRDDAEDPYRSFVGYFDPNEKLESSEFSALLERHAHCLNGFSDLNKWLDYVEAKAACDAKGLGSFTSAIEKKNNSIPDVCDAFERGFYSQWLGAVINEVPAVQSFRRFVHEQRSEKFVTLDTKQYQIARKRIRKRIISSYPDTNGVMRAGSELRTLTHEMEKKTKIMPLRRLFQSIPNLLLTLKPCLMMSPLSVAYFLDANMYQFDMVIFDEASQIFPQDAIGAIFRAKQVIIAGDTKQLPPTNFFASSTSNSSDGYDDEEGYDDEVYDSILEETTSVLPNRTLLWHYRSKREHLIAFSNQEIYRNNLITFPSSNESDPDTGVEFVYVPEGYYEPSPKNYNILEAQRCVQLVKEHIDKHSNRSLGIIAFSEKQQQAIALEIQRFREKNPEYENFFAEGKEDEFFVKNLENVQGDERDTIFFSVGYARTKEQKANGKPMAMRFGPLGVQGGERRLNVAITRAKINVKLISSILPSDIDLNKTESEGIRMLRSYIEFAMNGEVTLSAAHKVGKPDDFVDAIAQFIRDHGFKVRQYVGCSGYKIDIAVQHPSELIEQFVAGIECDGFSYASAKTARDRDRLRSTVLRGMGWNLYRVWSTEWHKNPEIEGQRLLEFIRKAISECDEKVKVLEEEKRRIEEEKRLELEKARVAREAEERRLQKEREEKEAKRRAQLEAVEQKKREEEERKTARIRAELETARKCAEEQKAAEEKARREAEERQQRNDLSWVKIGAKVSHKSFGTGVVTKLTKDQISVRFGSSERSFMYPSVLHNGLLTKPVAQAVTSSRPTNQNGPAWAKTGAPVMHKSFGLGSIVKIEGSNMAVRFGEAVKSFVYPDAITKGFLSRYLESSTPEEAQDEQMAIPQVIKSAPQDNSKKLIDELRAAGFSVIDNRTTSSIIWVIYVGGKTKVFEEIVSKYHAQYSLERRGSLATRNVPAWRVMAAQSVAK